MRIYMQRQAPGDPLRFFQLQVQEDLLGGWALVRESGFQGMKGQVKTEYFADREQAEAAFMRQRDKQALKGYRIVFREGA